VPYVAAPAGAVASGRRPDRPGPQRRPIGDRSGQPRRNRARTIVK